MDLDGFNDKDRRPGDALDGPPVQFMLGEAMISQKKLKKHSGDLSRVKELLAELQLYVQRHHSQLSKEMVTEIKLKVAIESLRNEMEIRYELALKGFYDKLKLQMAEHVTRDELQKKLLEKLHKREFEAQFDRINSTVSYIEQKV